MAVARSAVVVSDEVDSRLSAGLVRSFAREGYRVFPAGRDIAGLARVARSVSDAGAVVAVVTDATVECEVSSLFDYAEDDALLDLVVVRAPVSGGRVVAEGAARRFGSRGRGTAIFTSALAQDVAVPAASAPEADGVRAIVKSMTNELSPLGVHVAHIIVDNRVADGRVPIESGSRLKLDAITEAHLNLHRQHRSEWMHELDLRSSPFTSVAFTL